MLVGAKYFGNQNQVAAHRGVECYLRRGRFLALRIHVGIGACLICCEWQCHAQCIQIACRLHLVGEGTTVAKDCEKATQSIYLSRGGEEESEIDGLWWMVESLIVHSPFCQGLLGEWMLLLPGLTRRPRIWATRHKSKKMLTYLHCP